MDCTLTTMVAISMVLWDLWHILELTNWDSPQVTIPSIFPREPSAVTDTTIYRSHAITWQTPTVIPPPLPLRVNPYLHELTHNQGRAYSSTT